MGSPLSFFFELIQHTEVVTLQTQPVWYSSVKLTPNTPLESIFMDVNRPFLVTILFNIRMYKLHYKWQLSPLHKRTFPHVPQLHLWSNEETDMTCLLSVSTINIPCTMPHCSWIFIYTTESTKFIGNTHILFPLGQVQLDCSQPWHILGVLFDKTYFLNRHRRSWRR